MGHVRLYTSIDMSTQVSEDRTSQSANRPQCGVSAFRGKNRKKGDLSVFLAALEAGELEPNPVLILEDLDRLSRDKIMSSVDQSCIARRESVRWGPYHLFGSNFQVD